jgi:TIR domain
MEAESAEEARRLIFLYCTEEDEEPFGNWLYRKLQSANVTVWYAPHDALIGDTEITFMYNAYKRSDFLLLVISRWMVRNNSVRRALEPIIAQASEKQRITILPIILGRARPEEILDFFRGKKSIRFPREGSDEKFQELRKHINEHLRRASQLKPFFTSSHVVQTTLQNPFGLRGGVDPGRFIAPEPLVRKITEDILNRQSVEIIAASMMGKTSLLKFLESEQCWAYYQNRNTLISNLRFTHFELRGRGVRNRDELLPELACAMGERLPAKKRFKGSTHKEALEWIKSTAGEYSEDSPVWVLLWDEFDQVVQLDGIDTIFFEELYNLWTHYNLIYVIATRRKFNQFSSLLPKSSNSSFFSSPNIFTEHCLTVWDDLTTKTLMFKPHGKELGVFHDADFTFMVELTAQHPLLLQIGCDYLFNAYRLSSNRVVNYDQLLYHYMNEAEAVYKYYWDQEINNTERDWIRNYQAVLPSSKVSLEELRKNNAQQGELIICTRLRDLGFVLENEAKLLEVPKGLHLFLRSYLNLES